MHMLYCMSGDQGEQAEAVQHTSKTLQALIVGAPFRHSQID